MCTMSDTKVTTVIIMADSRSIRNPTWMFTPSLSSQVYTGPSKGVMPSNTSLYRTYADKPQEIATPAIVTE